MIQVSALVTFHICEALSTLLELHKQIVIMIKKCPIYKIGSLMPTCLRGILHGVLVKVRRACCECEVWGNGCFRNKIIRLLHSSIPRYSLQHALDTCPTNLIFKMEFCLSDNVTKKHLKIRVFFIKREAKRILLGVLPFRKQPRKWGLASYLLEMRETWSSVYLPSAGHGPWRGNVSDTECKLHLDLAQAAWSTFYDWVIKPWKTGFIMKTLTPSSV